MRCGTITAEGPGAPSCWSDSQFVPTATRRWADPSTSRSTVWAWPFLATGTTSLLALSVLGAIGAWQHGVTADAIGIAMVAALGIAIGVVRWRPSMSVDPARPVPTTLLLLLLASAVQLCLLTLVQPGWAAAIHGPLVTLALTGVYLASFQFRASFLLRRLTVLSVFLWIPVAHAVSGLVRTSLGPVSDLVYRRLAMLEVLSVEHHPWRLFSAMTDRATVIVIGTVMLTTALSRRRLSLRSLFAMVAVMTVGMIAHHLAVLLAPIERYDRPVWADIVLGSNTEVVLAIVAASIVTLLARARPDQASASTTVAADRDPVIFAVVDGDTTAPPLRILIALAMVVLVATVVMRT